MQKFDSKIQNINYKNSTKPYIGIILNINTFNYYVPISSVKSKHYFMSENIDFIKLIDKQQLLSVINLNNMIPIPNSEITFLNYTNITDYFYFPKESNKIKYISLLKKELSILNNKKIIIYKKAKKLYSIKIKYPNSDIAKRCCNFSFLENKCEEYIKYKIKNHSL